MRGIGMFFWGVLRIFWDFINKIKGPVLLISFWLGLLNFKYKILMFNFLKRKELIF